MSFINNQPATPEHALDPKEVIAQQAASIDRNVIYLQTALYQGNPDIFEAAVPQPAQADVRPDTAAQVISLAAVEEDRTQAAEQTELDNYRATIRRIYDEAA